MGDSGNCAVHGERCERCGGLGVPGMRRIRIGFEGRAQTPRSWRVKVVTGGTTRRSPLMLGRLVLEPQHVGVWQELGTKFCGEVIPNFGRKAASCCPQVLHRVIHRSCGFPRARAQRDGSSDLADDRSERCATGPYAYPGPRTGRAASADGRIGREGSGHRCVTRRSQTGPFLARGDLLFAASVEIGPVRTSRPRAHTTERFRSALSARTNCHDRTTRLQAEAPSRILASQVDVTHVRNGGDARCLSLEFVLCERQHRPAS